MAQPEYETACEKCWALRQLLKPGKDAPEIEHDKIFDCMRYRQAEALALLFNKLKARVRAEMAGGKARKGKPLVSSSLEQFSDAEAAKLLVGPEMLTIINKPAAWSAVRSHKGLEGLCQTCFSLTQKHKDNFSQLVKESKPQRRAFLAVAEDL